MKTTRYRAWRKPYKGIRRDFEGAMYSVDTLSFPLGGVIWHGPGVGEGICEANPEYDWEVNSILMQYTGYKDKNDEEVCEGDLFGNIKEIRCVVERQDNGAVELVFLDKRITQTWSITDPRLAKSEIIGNIYENPELMEVQVGDK